MNASERSFDRGSSPGRPHTTHRARRHRVRDAAVTLALAAGMLWPSLSTAVDWGISIPRGSYAKGYTPKGTAIVKQGDLYHAFYSLENWESNDPYRLTKKFGHSTSPDLKTWTFLDTSFAVSTTGWDRDYIWAPQIVVENSVFHLFYTGVQMVTGQAMQKTMHATATALSTTVGGATAWTRSNNPVYERPLSWTNPALPADFRDPFIMPSPYSSGSNSGWFSYHVGHLDPFLEINPNPQNYVVGAARAAAGALTSWSDRGPLVTTDYDWQWPQGGPGVRSRLLESPHIVSHDGTYYLFFSGDFVDGTGSVRYLTGTNPLGDAWTPNGQWTFKGFVPGLHEWAFNSESFSESYADGKDDYFAYVQDTQDSWDRYVQVKQLVWTPEEPQPFVLVDPLKVTSITFPFSGNALTEGGLGYLFFLTAHQDEYPRTLRLEAFEVDGATRTPIDPNAIGIPNAITYVRSSPIVPFTPHFVPDDDDTPNRMEIVLRYRGYESSMFTITPNNGTPTELHIPTLEPTAHYTPKDWGILKVDSLYHAFYIMTNWTSPEAHREENRLGHATSQDLRVWKFGADASTAFFAAPNDWGPDHVWAPTLVERNGVFWMFYTGVKDSTVGGVPKIVQRIGAAYTTNHDLTGWTRVSGPVNVCGAPWMSCTNFNFRDPFVMPYAGGAAGGPGWLMYVTTNSSSGESVLDLSRSDDLGTWPDVGPLLETRITGKTLESPHVLKHGNEWFLFESIGFDGSVRQFRGTDPGDTSWTPMAALTQIDNNRFASEAFTETYPDSRTEDFFGIVSDDQGSQSRHLEFYQMDWYPDGTFTLFDPLKLDQIDVTPAAPTTVTSGGAASLTLHTANVPGRSRIAPIEVFEVDATSRTKISPTVMGLPLTVTINSYPTQTVNFTAQYYSDDDGTPARSEFLIRIKGVEASSQLWVQSSGGGGGGGGPFEMDGKPASTLPTVLAFRAIGETPITAGEGLLIELPAASKATLDLFDVRGRRIRRLMDRDLDPGATIEVWDRKDEGGRAVAPGVYFARLDTRLGMRAARVIVIR